MHCFEIHTHELEVVSYFLRQNGQSFADRLSNRNRPTAFAANAISTPNCQHGHQ